MSVTAVCNSTPGMPPSLAEKNTCSKP